MSVWDLNNIRQKVRQVSGRYSSDELSTDELDARINEYTQYTLPAELKLERAHTFYEFLTLANQQKYTLPIGYTNFEPPASIDRLSILWYQEPAAFYENNPENIARVNIGTGDGIVVTFNGTGTNTPILPGSAVITDNVEVFEDTNTTYTDANINLTGSLGGSATLNYATGVVSVTFNTAPPTGNNIVFSYIQFMAGRPTAVLLYNNEFTFFPVPDTAYRFRTKAYTDILVVDASGNTSNTFINATDRPLLDQWGPMIAYGTVRDIFSDYGETDAYAEVTILYKEQLSYALRRTNQNLLNTRSLPHF